MERLPVPEPVGDADRHQGEKTCLNVQQRSIPREFENEGGLRGLLRRALGRSPLDAIALFVLLIAAGAILLNALYRQPGPHPAPIFSVKPRPVATEPAERGAADAAHAARRR